MWRHLRTWLPVLIALIALWTYTTYGFGGQLDHDDGIFAYSGQRMVEGAAPYVGMFDIKPPGSPMLCGLGAWLGRALAVDSLLAIRATYLVIAVLTVIALYYLALTLTGSAVAASFACFVFIGYEGFIWHAASGPRPKTAMLLFAVLAMLLTARRRWLLAAMSGAAAALVWQPMIVIPIATIALAWLQGEPDRRGAVLRALVGVALPVAGVVAYFAATGALEEMIGGSFLVLLHMHRPPQPLSSRLWHPLHAIYEGYSNSMALQAIGLVGIGVVYRERLRGHGGVRGVLANDRWAIMLALLPLFVVWSLLDFQKYPDFYVFLPYCAVGFGIVMQPAVAALTAHSGDSALLRRAVLVGLALAVMAPTIVAVKYHPGTGLAEQQRRARLIEEKIGDGRALVVGAPELLAISDITNPTPYVVFANGIDEYLDAAHPSGFEGWVGELDRHDPEVVVWQSGEGRHVHLLTDWIAREYTVWRELGTWIVYERREGAGRQTHEPPGAGR